MAIQAITNPTSVFTDVNAVNASAAVGEQASKQSDTVVKTQTEGADVSQQQQSDTSQQGRYEVENTSDVSAEKIKKAVEEINQKIRPKNTSCQFSYHEETNRISIKVIDTDEDKVIREIPAEKTLDIIAKTL
jgi:flagellar protein FlaG